MENKMRAGWEIWFYIIFMQAYSIEPESCMIIPARIHRAMVACIEQ